MVDDLTARLRTLAERVAGTHGLDVFDVQFRRESHGVVLRVILDTPWTPDRPPAREPDGGPGAMRPEVTIDDCQRVSQDLSAVLDVEEERIGLPDVKYTLEVSSPGLDRPLRGEGDYRRFTGRLAKLVTVEPVEGQTSFAGRLSGLDDAVVLLQEGRRTHRVPLALIKRARLDVEF